MILGVFQRSVSACDGAAEGAPALVAFPVTFICAMSCLAASTCMHMMHSALAFTDMHDDRILALYTLKVPFQMHNKAQVRSHPGMQCVGNTKMVWNSYKYLSVGDWHHAKV
jgi:hypothetical protein